jgi:hypothetical protein
MPDQPEIVVGKTYRFKHLYRGWLVGAVRYIGTVEFENLTGTTTIIDIETEPGESFSLLRPFIRDIEEIA